MDHLDDTAVDQTTFRLGLQFKKFGLSSSLAFFDTTNLSIEQASRPGNTARQLLRPGHAKNRKRQAELLRLATATSREHHPTFHRMYPGHANDARLLRKVVRVMGATLAKLGGNAEELCFVRAKGMNSEKGWTAGRHERVHIVGSSKRSQLADLMCVPLAKFSRTYTTERGEMFRMPGSERTVLGVKGTLAVAHNPAAERRQAVGCARTKARFLVAGTTFSEAPAGGIWAGRPQSPGPRGN